MSPGQTFGDATDAGHQDNRGRPNARGGVPAWEVGRCLNRLCFWMQQTWLRPTAARRRMVRQLWDRFESAACALAAQPLAEDRIRDRIRALTGIWDAAYRDPAHADRLGDAEAAVTRTVRQTGETTEEECFREECSSVCRTLPLGIEDLYNAIACALPGPGGAILHLARLVDEGRYPRSILDRVPRSRVERAATLPATRPASANPVVAESTEAESAGWMTRSQGVENGAGFQNPSDPGLTSWMARCQGFFASTIPTPPDTLWLENLRRRWEQAGLDEHAFPDTAGIDLTRRRSIRHLVNQLNATARQRLTDTATRDAIAPVPESLPVPETAADAYRRTVALFELVLDEDAQSLTRIGCPAPVDRLSPRHWKLLSHFLSTYPEPQPLNWLRHNWNCFGRRATDSRNTVYVAINELKEMLKAIDLDLESDGHNQGWRLFDLRAPTHRAGDVRGCSQ